MWRPQWDGDTQQYPRREAGEPDEFKNLWDAVFDGTEDETGDQVDDGFDADNDEPYDDYHDSWSREDSLPPLERVRARDPHQDQKW